MKPLLLILAAFFVQSCYTSIYVTGDYNQLNETVVTPPPPYYPPELPPQPGPYYIPQENPVVPPFSQPSRPRTDGATRGGVTTTPPAQGTGRERAAVPPVNSGSSAANQNPTPTQSVERQRADSGTPQVKPARPR